MKLQISEVVLLCAVRIKSAIGVVNDNYHSKGVDENDLFIIAVAQTHGAELITNEARQFGAQQDPRKFKIPAVCDMPTVRVTSLNFFDYIQKSKQVF
ncbi:DUF4411 family protein [Ottowia sp.]|uniref:DUF4411 family protein n=1 Tax=Ottowia sp. TaxID=1898956 RepID=UPI003A8A65DA